MEQLDYDYTIHNAQGAEADKGLAVRFFKMAVQDFEATAAQGRPIFKDTDMVEIRVRGSRNDVLHKPVDDLTKRRFRDAWRAYEQGEELLESGTPLEQWPQMTRAQVEEMKYFGFRTVEHIANARDDLTAKFPGLLGLKMRAKAFLELASGAAPLASLQSQLEEEKSARLAAEAQVADLAQRMSAMEAGLAKGEPVVATKTR